MKKYAFWNNKGGTGKTSLAFQVITQYAHENPDMKVLAIDVCPQANLSELLLGGIHQGGSDNLLMRQGEQLRATIGGYFQLRLPSPYNIPDFEPRNFLTKPSDYNSNIPSNIDLLCGDPLLELQANSMSTLANTQVPGTDTWIAVASWLRDFIEPLSTVYDVVFLDTNPSFSIYTQTAIAAAEKLILPVMADDSSRRAIQNVFSLVYGLKLPSDIYAQHAFAQRIHSANRELPQVHLILKNRITQYMGPASAYATVLESIDKDIENLLETNSEMFTFSNVQDGTMNIRDFQTAGVVAYARGCPFYNLPVGRLDIIGQRVQVNKDRRDLCLEDITAIATKL